MTSPEMSLRRRLQEVNLDISVSSVQWILTDDLNLRAYHTQIKQKLVDTDCQASVDMCTEFQRKMEQDPAWIQNVWFTDKAHVLLSGHVHSKNCVYWSDHPPDYVLERPLHAVKCTARVALSSCGLMALSGLKMKMGRLKEWYVQVLEQFWREVEERGFDICRMWFQ